MKILFVSNYPSASLGGGMSRVAYELAVATALSHEVMLMCPGRVNTAKIAAKGEVSYAQVASLGRGDNVLPDIRARNRRWIDLVLTTFRPDIIHVQDMGSLSLYLQDLAIQVNLPYLITLHCSLSHINEFGSQEVSRLLKLIDNSNIYKGFLTKFINRCDGVVTLNSAIASDLAAFNYRGLTYRVPNGRNLVDFSTSKKTDPIQLDKQLLYIGSYAVRKNQRFLLEMMTHLSFPFRLELIGAIQEPIYMRRLEQYAADLGLSNVVFTQQLPFEQISLRLQQSHVFVSASTLEVQSLSVIEALASGTPVVGLANDTTTELVDDSVGCCLPVDATPEMFAQRVKAICSLPDDNYAEMSRAARERVRHLDWQNVVKQNTIVYQDMIDRKKCTTTDRRQPRSVWIPLLTPISITAWSWHDISEHYKKLAANSSS